jgi:hypothetical protein
MAWLKRLQGARIPTKFEILMATLGQSLGGSGGSGSRAGCLGAAVVDVLPFGTGPAAGHRVVCAAHHQPGWRSIRQPCTEARPAGAEDQV